MFHDGDTGLTLGERAAIEGVLAQLRPLVAIELGVDRGGTLRRIATYATEVHAFDYELNLSEPPSNVILHLGDIRHTLPATLRDLTSRGQTVGFVFVDADHTSRGVGQDLRDLLDSDAVEGCVILLHDIMNESVRRGIFASGALRHPKVSFSALNFVEVPQNKPPWREGWSGLGLLVVGALPGPIRAPETESFWTTPLLKSALWRWGSAGRKLYPRRLIARARRMLSS